MVNLINLMTKSKDLEMKKKLALRKWSKEAKTIRYSRVGEEINTTTAEQMKKQLKLQSLRSM